MTWAERQRTDPELRFDGERPPARCYRCGETLARAGYTWLEEVAEVVVPRVCAHPLYTDGHCAEMSCLAYAGRCPRHSYSGSRQTDCNVPTEHVIVHVGCMTETEVLA